jgi:hypothetical protein
VNDLCLVKQLLYWICLTSWYIDLTHYTHHCCCSHTALSANNNKNGAFRTVCSEHIHVHRVDLLGAIHKFHFYFILMHNIPKVFLGNFFLGGGGQCRGRANTLCYEHVWYHVYLRHSVGRIKKYK